MGLAAGLSQLPSFGSGVPHAYLRLLVYKADSTVLADRIVPITTAAHAAWAPITLPQFVLPTGAAYAQVYVANESNVPVWFDDVKIEHWQGLQVQENHYDPFGLELAGLSRSTPGLRTLNQYQWNGKEKQSDFGLGWTHLDWRFFDAQTGRFHTVDPLSDNGQEMWSTYQFGFDNAVRYNDPDGRNPWGDDIVHYANGFINAVASNATTTTTLGGREVGLVARREGNTDFTNGQALGDKASVVIGLGEVFLGYAAATLGVGGGLATAPTGVGPAAGATLATAGVAAAGHGAQMATNGVKNSLRDNKGRVEARSATSGENSAAAKGRQAHKDYNPGKGYETDPSKNRLQNGKVPDAINRQKRIVRELKPNNPKAIKRGEKQVEGYRKQLEKETGKKWTGKVDTY